MNDETTNRPNPTFLPMQRLEKPIDNIDLQRVNDFRRTIQLNPSSIFYATNESNSTITSFQSPDRKLRIQFINSPKVKIKGVSIGDPLFLIQSRFQGIEFEQERFNDGLFLMNFAKGLIFQINERGTIEKWGIFSI